MINISTKHRTIVESILSKYPYTFYAFGSRVTGIPRKFSDLDICFFENIPWNIQEHIEEDFQESDLPYSVDIINWNMCDSAFQNAIRETLVLIQKSP